MTEVSPREVARKEIALAAKDFWWWAPNYVQTNDFENGRIAYFPEKKWVGKFRTSTYLYDFTTALDENRLVVVRKGRRLLISLTILLRFFHRAQFAGTGLPGTFGSYAAALMSTDEDSAKGFLKHLYSIYDRLPEGIKQINPITVRNSLQMIFKAGGEIQAFSLKEDGPRSFGFTDILFDEAAFQAYAATTYAGARPTIGVKGSIIIVSTPNGQYNFFHDVWTNAHNQYSEFKRLDLIDWNIHPERDEEWLRKTKGSMSRQDFAREFEGSFTMAAGQPVYAQEYDSIANETDDESATAYNPGRVVFMGWDLGYFAPATIFCQLNNKGQMLPQHEIPGLQDDIWDFGKKVREMRAGWYPPNATFVHFLPPDAYMNMSQRSKHGHINDYQALFAIPCLSLGVERGVFCGEQVYRCKVEIQGRLSSVRKLLRIRDDGRAGMVISKKWCPFLIDGFRGGYAFPPLNKIKDLKKIEPEKGPYSHIHDALQGVCSGYGAVIGGEDKKMEKKRLQSIADATNWRIGT